MNIIPLANTPVVIDAGSFSIKIGFAGEPRPRVVHRTLLGFPSRPPIDGGKEGIIGEAAMTARDTNDYYTLHHPIEYGYIGDFELFGTILAHLFREHLEIDPRDHPVFISESPVNPGNLRERTAGFLLDSFLVQSFAIGKGATGLLMDMGWPTGIVLDAGYMASFVTPYCERYMLAHAMGKTDLGGRHVDAVLSSMIVTRNNLDERAIIPVVEACKRHHCRVTDPGTRFPGVPEPSIEVLLPGGETVMLDGPFLHAPDLLVDPANNGLDHAIGLGNMVVNSILRCDEELREDITRHVIITGGSSMFPQFPERIEADITRALGKDYRVNVQCSLDREIATWQALSRVVDARQDTIPWLTTAAFNARQSLVHQDFLVHDP